MFKSTVTPLKIALSKNQLYKLVRKVKVIPKNNIFLESVNKRRSRRDETFYLLYKLNNMETYIFNDKLYTKEDLENVAKRKNYTFEELLQKNPSIKYVPLPGLDSITLQAPPPPPSTEMVGSPTHSVTGTGDVSFTASPPPPPSMDLQGAPNPSLAWSPNPMIVKREAGGDATVNCVMSNHDQPIATTMTRDESVVEASFVVPPAASDVPLPGLDSITLQVEIDRKVTKRKVSVGCAESSYEGGDDDDCDMCGPMLCVSCWLLCWGEKPYIGPFCKYEKEIGGRLEDVGCVIDPVSWRWVPASGLISAPLYCVVALPVYMSSVCCPKNCAVVTVENESFGGDNDDCDCDCS